MAGSPRNSWERGHPGRMVRAGSPRSQQSGQEVRVPSGMIIDSDLTLNQALLGQDIPTGIHATLELINVVYWSFDDLEHRGQIVVARDLKVEVAEIFATIRALRFPVAQVVPVVRFGWSDDASMAANNSSGFNYRTIAGTDRLSLHAHGRAIDINPALNPYVRGEIVEPPGAVYDPSCPGTLVGEGPVVAAFESRGWTWGGRWSTRQDWHHFERGVGNEE